MTIIVTERGFEWLEHPTYGERPEDKALVRQSSAVGHYDDAVDRPGSSFLWIGNQDAKKTHHLNRGEVAQLVEHLQAWLERGTLETAPANIAGTE